MLQPDGVSTTYTSYSGNQTTVTDPVGKTKTFTSDVQGNLTTVAEPDPCVSGNTLTTSYTYDWMNHLSGVTMTRPGTTWTGAACTETGSPATQTRTFVYDDAGRLTSAANPENGKVTYSYNNDNTLSSKLDANGHQTTYTYDGQKRVTGIQRDSDPCRQVTYSYDANPYDSTGTFQYTYGRLAAALYPVCSANTAGGPTPTVTEMYSYTPAGLATVKRLHIYLPFYDTLYGGFRDAWSDTQASFSYTGWGALSGMTLPAEATNNGSTTCSSCGWHTVPVTFYTGYDSAGRPDSMTDNDQNAINGSGRTWVENVAYDYAGRMTSSDTWTGIYDNRYYYFDPVNGWTCCNDYYTDVYNRETRAYNVNGQMTSQLWSSNGGGTSFPTATGNQYIYSPPGTPTPNNGQVIQEVKGSETVTYQYDALKRLISSSATPVTGSTPAAWTQTFQYDGFGNLTGKVLSGTATAIPVDNATNRLTNATYDNNGNMLTGSVNGSGVTLGYDGANRMISATKYSGGTELYGYAPDNKRIVTVPADGSSPVWTLWGPQGQKLGDFNIVGNFVGSGVQTWSNFTGYVSVVGPTLYFAGRKIWEQGADGEWNTTAVNNGGSVVTDRLGSAGVYLPYGDTNGSAAGGRSFATYARGSLTGLDYADQRFYASSYGRFNRPDPLGHASVGDPSSWNQYAYVSGDPINNSDPSGLDPDNPSTWDSVPPAPYFCWDSGDENGPPNMTCFGNNGSSNRIASPGPGKSGNLGGTIILANQIKRSVLAQAQAALQSPKCASLFKDSNGNPLKDSNGNPLDPSSVLAGLSSGTAYGSISFGVTPPGTLATTQGNGLATYSSQGVSFSNVSVTLNMGAWLNDPSDDVITLLHELGHAIADLSPGWSSGNSIQNDGWPWPFDSGNAGTSLNNDTLIPQNCNWKIN